MENFSARDANFYYFIKSLLLRSKDEYFLHYYEEKDADSKDLDILLNRKLSINAEIGYGGARVMDVRWTGKETLNKLSNCIGYCEKINLLKNSSNSCHLRLVGLSAGNLIVYTLALLISVRKRCCGFEPRRKYLGKVIRESFKNSTGFDIKHIDERTCVCDVVRRLADTLLEVTALQEHPSWKEVVDPNTKIHIPSNTIKDIFYGKKNVETILDFTQDQASGYTDLYLSSPVQYLVNMYRAIDGLPGRLALLYIMCRHLILFCSEWLMDEKDGEGTPMNFSVSFFLGAKSSLKGTTNDSFIYQHINDFDYYDMFKQKKTQAISKFGSYNNNDNNMNIAKEGFIPLSVLIDYKKNCSEGLPNSSKDASNVDLVNLINIDCEKFNNSVNDLLGSINIQEIVMPIMSELVFPQNSVKLAIRQISNIDTVTNWFWDGCIPSYQVFDKDYFILLERDIKTLDIMTRTNESLQDIELYFKELYNTNISSNYIFEISPAGRHMFNVDRVDGLVEASLPLVTPWQLKAEHMRRGNKLVALLGRVDRKANRNF